MHWILTVSDTFLLTQVIQQSQHMLHPPFTVENAWRHLGRVERLTSGRAAALTISQSPAGLVLQCHEHLSDRDSEELSHKTWRMLRLGEDLQPFLELARRTPGLRSTLQNGVRLLRGTTLFEDVVRAIILSMDERQWYDQRMAWIVDRFGDPLPSNPTLHAFPTPSQIVRGYGLLAEVFDPVNAENLVAVAAEFQTESKRIDADVNKDQPLEVLKETLTSHLKLNETALGLVMLALGRYDFIPTDHHAQERVRQHTPNRSNSPAAIQAMFEPWQPWGGLAFWLWDWSVDHPDNGDITWKA